MRLSRGYQFAVAFLLSLLLITFSYAQDQATGKWKISGDIQSTQPYYGITHTRIIQKKPRPTIINILTIDPKADGIRFLTTPPSPNPKNKTERSTTRKFVAKHHAAAGINTAFYEVKNGVNIIGFAASEGKLYSAFCKHWPALNITKDNVASIVEPVDPTANDFHHKPSSTPIYNAISGSTYVLKNGVMPKANITSFNTIRHPRTAVGIKKDGKILFVTVDGRQADFTEGMSIFELAALFRELGCVEAINLDGGGSTTMVLSDPTPRVVNYPSDAKSNGQAGMERNVAANLIVFAKPKLTNYKPLPPAKRPAPPKALLFTKTKKIIDNFEKSLGHFTSNPASSGSSRGIDKSKTKAKIVKTKSPHGRKSLAVHITRDPEKDNFKIRQLSGGGNPANNEVLGRVGSIGVWVKTKSPNIKVSILLDDTAEPAKRRSKSLERGIYKPIAADGKWHFYKWDLQKVAHWRNYYAGNGAIEGPNTTIDAILFYSSQKYNNTNKSVDLLIDAVTYDPKDDFE